MSSYFSFQDLFFKYSLNNFLHAQVEQCITCLFTWNPQQQLPEVPTTVSGEEEPDETKESVNISTQNTPVESPIENKGRYYGCFLLIAWGTLKLSS